MAQQAKLKTVNIKGKAYTQVHTRINFFRGTGEDGLVWKDGKGADWGIEVNPIDVTPEHAFMQAVIKDESGRIRATGEAFELQSGSNINKTSHVENCSTSAIGRALGNLGIGTSESFASTDEVSLAMAQQANSDLKDAKIEIEYLKNQLSQTASSSRPTIGDDWTQYFIQSFENVQTYDEAESLMTTFMAFSSDPETLQTESPELMASIEGLKGKPAMNLSVSSIFAVQKAYNARLQQIAGSTNYCNILYSLMQNSDGNTVMAMFNGKSSIFTKEHQDRIKNSLGLKKWLLGQGVSENDILSTFTFLSDKVEEAA